MCHSFQFVFCTFYNTILPIQTVACHEISTNSIQLLLPCSSVGIFKVQLIVSLKNLMTTLDKTKLKAYNDGTTNLKKDSGTDPKSQFFSSRKI